jgi:sulfite reductase alpha subunit-like flavoprotein
MSRLLILYASQTGHAIETAERIKREGLQRHLIVEMKSMDEYSISKLPKENLVAFVCSVTGQGEEPDSMKSFWKFLLRKNLDVDSLTVLKFGVFGQGDSSYAKFNFPAKKLHKRLLQLGAEAIVPRGDGDDQHYLGVDGALDPWLEEFWKKVLDIYPIPKGKRIIPDTVLPLNTYKVEEFFGDSDEEYDSSYPQGLVLKNERETPESHFQDVRRIEIDSLAKYNPGDALVVYPQNRTERIQEVLEYFGWVEIGDKLFKFSGSYVQ